MSDDIEHPERLDKTRSYKWNDPFLNILLEYRNICICDGALAWCEAQYAAEPSITFGEAMENFIADPNAEEGWAAMNLEYFGELIDNRLRTGFVKKMKDPMQSYVIDKNFGHLMSQSDKQLLRNNYDEKLPDVDKSWRTQGG